MTLRRPRPTSPASAFEPLEQRRLLAAAAKDALLNSLGESTLPLYLPQQYSLWKSSGTLTSQSSAAPLTIAQSYLRRHAGELGLLSSDLRSAVVTDQYTDTLTGLTHIYLGQTLNGLPVLNSQITVNVMKDGRILSINGGFIPGLSKQENPLALRRSSRLAAASALTIASRLLNLGANPSITPVGRISLLGARTATLHAPTLSLDQIKTQWMYVPTADGGVQPAWSMTLRTTDGEHWYSVAVGDRAGEIVFVNDWVNHASYDVIPQPTESPIDGESYPNRQIVIDPTDLIASPHGWHDTNGVAGPEFTDTRGNNVSAQEDTNANNTGGFRPDGGPTLTFDFPLDLTQAPSTYQSAAITNLFYWNNVVHDITYRYGFNEVAGNFQINNYGNGGTGNDAVQADAQDGSGTNNANFATPPDGSAPRMQMFLFNTTTPNRDGDLDNQIIVHEYGHGISNRLTGGPSNANALDALQSSGMGEGWSDFLALMLTLKPGDTQADAFPIGTYVLGESSTGAGIRRYPYSFDMSVNPLTIDRYGVGTTSDGIARSTEVHDTGEIWCAALWDMAWILSQKYGFDANYTTGLDPQNISGNALAMQLVMDGMKLQQANPTFAQARDAILQADLNLSTALGIASNQSEIWAAFARRGMGTGFSTASSGAASVTVSYDAPTFFVRKSTPSGTSLGPVSAIDITFNKAVDTATFSIAQDVLSFTGPGASNLLSSISGSAWVDASTLRISFTSTIVEGAYGLVLGPDISALSGGQTLDNDFDITPGEAGDDNYTASFTFDPTFGPDGYGYTASTYAYENINLVIGQSGVTTLFNNTDDATGFINLGANSFNFYGTTYTGSSSLVASANGLLTFVSGTTDFNNSELRTTPSQRTIAPMWDDWRTDVNITDDSAVLYKIDAANNRLIVEWSDVPHYVSSSSSTQPATFQAIFQLNTGSLPGHILLNYPDLDTGNSSFSNGADATIGIKDSGVQGINRLLISKDSGTHPWISSGKAIIIGVDITSPKVSQEQFAYQSSQSLVYTFTEDVGTSLTASDMILYNMTTSQTILPSSIVRTYNSLTRTATFTFPGVTGGILPDGNYLARFNAGSITDAAGNALDSVNGVGSAHDFTFFVLAADANHDRAVDITDFTVVGRNWLASPRDFTQGDFNYDGVVDQIDLGIVSGSWQKTLPAETSVSSPPLALPAAAPVPARTAPLAPATAARRRVVDLVDDML